MARKKEKTLCPFVFQRFLEGKSQFGNKIVLDRIRAFPLFFDLVLAESPSPRQAVSIETCVPRANLENKFVAMSSKQCAEYEMVMKYLLASNVGIFVSFLCVYVVYIFLEGERELGKA